MVEIGVKAGAALSRITARLAPLVTNSIIDGVARHFRVTRLAGSNKVDKLHGFLVVMLSDEVVEAFEIGESLRVRYAMRG